MPRFICTKSETVSVPVGTVLVGKLINPGRFKLTRNSELIHGISPRFCKGTEMPLKGCLWSWELDKDINSMSITDCKSESPQEALENFEKAVRAHEMIGAQDPEDRPGIEEDYEAAKAEVLIWMSYIP